METGLFSASIDSSFSKTPWTLSLTAHVNGSELSWQKVAEATSSSVMISMGFRSCI